jgi:hypothetical protein
MLKLGVFIQAASNIFIIQSLAKALSTICFIAVFTSLLVLHQLGVNLLILDFID